MTKMTMKRAAINEFNTALKEGDMDKLKECVEANHELLERHVESSKVMIEALKSKQQEVLAHVQAMMRAQREANLNVIKKM